ncbi:MAG: hypothetical protein MR210_05260 [Erysipelotrichaceae bacterium]|nr:hypothetical protein [Erysipelotrichaceae bacterium]MDY5252126.1 hypothetical protein [Erysipelotrichaceae bacterium]
MSYTGLILVSHGEFAKAALASSEMIAGKQENVIALGLKEDTSLEQMVLDIKDAYQKLKANCENILILCDIYGGTPFNAITRNMLEGMEAKAFTGLSLPLLIDTLLSRDMIFFAEIDEHIRETHEICCQKIEVAVKQDDADEMDL